MKKARVLLSAIAILAVIGGTVSFKASKTYGSVIYTTSAACGVATLTVVNWTITAADFQGARQTFATDTYNGIGCETFITQRN